MRIISADLAENLAPSAGLRNRLVPVDHSLVSEAVKMAEELYPEYIQRDRELYLRKNLIVSKTVDE